jgi:hypothetical protein
MTTRQLTTPQRLLSAAPTLLWLLAAGFVIGVLIALA